MGKKKLHGDQKPVKAEVKQDTTTSPSKKSHSNKKKNAGNPSSATPASILSGSVLLLIGVSVTVVLGAVIVMNQDVQNYLVSLTPMGSNPLEHILSYDKGKPETDGKNSASIPDNTADTSESDKANKQNVDGDNSKTKEKADELVNNRKEDNVKSASNEKAAEKSGNNGKDSEKSGNNEKDSEKSGNNGKDSEKSENNEKDSEKSASNENESDKEIEVNGKGIPVEDSEISNETGDQVVESKEMVEDGKKQKKKVKRTDYVKHEITNKGDFKIRKKLDVAEELREEGNLKGALDKYTSILTSNPESPRALYGKSLVTDRMAEQQHSNQLLEEAMNGMDQALRQPDTPKQLRVEIGHKLAGRQSFRGWEGKAARTWRFLMENYPDEILFQQKYGTCFLIMGKNDRARDIFKTILEKYPDDSYSLLHLGFIVKSVDTDYKVAIPLLQRGIDLDTEGTTEGKFFYHLGDAYLRTNQTDKAQAVYRQGAERGLFLSQYQRSLYNADTPLTGRPWWTPEQTTYQSYFQILEKHWKTIREEGLNQLNHKTGSFLPEEENLREAGDWKQFTLYQRGRMNEENCKKVPKTCALLERIPDATGCTRGQIKYSVMQPGVHVWPHTGPTNCRIRAHLGLKIPPGPRIRVGNDTRTWIEGKFIIFDDSFEHEVWHDGSELRMVLIVDFWHPELTDHQKKTLSPI